MADFHQNGSVATLHNLAQIPFEQLEAQLKQFAKTRKITLILPSLYSELEAPALSNIVDELSKADFVNHIVIGLDIIYLFHLSVSKKKETTILVCYSIEHLFY